MRSRRPPRRMPVRRGMRTRPRPQPGQTERRVIVNLSWNGPRVVTRADSGVAALCKKISPLGARQVRWATRQAYCGSTRSDRRSRRRPCLTQATAMTTCRPGRTCPSLRVCAGGAARRRSFPEAMSHSLGLPSLLVVTTSVPLGLNVTLRTRPFWPADSTCRPVAASQKFRLSRQIARHRSPCHPGRSGSTGARSHAESCARLRSATFQIAISDARPAAASRLPSS